MRMVSRMSLKVLSFWHAQSAMSAIIWTEIMYVRYVEGELMDDFAGEEAEEIGGVIGMIKKVVFMGTPDFAVGTLQALIDSKYEVAAVFSQPDKPKGRGKALQMTPTKEVAVEAGIPVYQPAKIREAQWLSVLEELAPDVIVVVAFGQIIPESILKLAEIRAASMYMRHCFRNTAARRRFSGRLLTREEESGVTDDARWMPDWIPAICF